MIDTEKYEGHTRGPWDTLVCSTTGKKWVIDGPEDSAWESIALIDRDLLSSSPQVGEDDVDWKNMTLIADAPLLLAEVLRLRRLNNYLWEHRSSHWSADDDAEMDRLEMIE